MKASLELFITDPHFPDVDPACWKIALEIAKSFPFDLVWLNGDFLDFKSVSHFPTNPVDRFKLTKCLDSGRSALRELRNVAPKAQMVFREGNHDRRLQSYINAKAPELSFLEELSLSSLLGLKDLDIQFKGGDDRTKVGELFHIHGDELPTGSIFPARAALARAHTNLIFGHRHKFSVAYEQSFEGHNHVAWSIGTLQNTKVDYSYHPDWQQGLAIVSYIPSGLFNVEPIPIFQDGKRKRAMVHGQLFSA